MEYRLLGLSGCAVSALALGTLTFGNETSEADSFAQLDRFVSAGGTLIDTADVYADGRSEQIIGRWLASWAEARERAVIAERQRDVDAVLQGGGAALLVQPRAQEVAERIDLVGAGAVVHRESIVDLPLVLRVQAICACVDVRRAAVGLEPLADYLQRFGVDYSAPPATATARCARPQSGRE